MKNVSRALVLACALSLSACEEVQLMTEHAATEEKPEISHTVADLGEWILLPATPNSAKWRTSRSFPESRDTALTALLHFAPKDYEYIIKNSEKHDVLTDAIVGREFYEEWAPEEVKKEFKTEPFSDLSVSLVDRPALRPNLFVDLDNGTSPYIHGNIYPIGNGYIIVSLSTM